MIHRPFFHSENSAKITDIPTIGQVVTNHNSSTMADEYNATRRTTYRSLVPGLSTGSSSSATPASPTSVPQKAAVPTQHPHQQEVRVQVALREYGETRRVNQKKTKTKKKDNERVRGDPLRDLPEWLEEFTENLVDESVPEHRDAPASSSHELLSEPRGNAVSGKQSIFTHFPKDRNCDICLRSRITRAYCRKRTGVVVPQAGKFDDLITADHKVLSEGCES